MVLISVFEHSYRNQKAKMGYTSHNHLVWQDSPPCMTGKNPMMWPNKGYKNKISMH